MNIAGTEALLILDDSSNDGSVGSDASVSYVGIDSSGFDGGALFKQKVNDINKKTCQSQYRCITPADSHFL